MRNGAIQGLTAARAQIKQANLLADGASVELFDEGGGLFTLVFTFPDSPDSLVAAPPEVVAASPAARADAGPVAAPALAPTGVAAAVAAASAVASAAASATGAALLGQIGALSRAFESNGRPAAIGRDKNGGFSYGQYQLACRPGTMSAYLAFLSSRYPALAQPLTQAGGPDGAAAGSAAFQAAWRTLADQAEFAESQQDFIAQTHYQPFVKHLRDALGLDVAQRSAALRDVAWSVAVQHGASNAIFDAALKPLGRPLPVDDAALINAIYDERSKVDRYFSQSTADVREAVASRLRQERQLALNAFGSSGSTLA